MLKTLTYAVTFSNSKKLSRTLSFEAKGTTLITGKNEAGKSMNLEMASFALFGNVALRGQTSDYSRIKCEAEFEVKGQAIKIERTKSSSSLFIGDEQTATGTKPVNDAIIALLGYDYSVYRIAHLAAQGDLQALSTMKPTERKAMVDTVSGLNQLDAVAKDLEASRKELRGTIQGAELMISEPTAPTQPDTNRDTLERTKEALDVKASELKELQKLNNLKRPNPPVYYEPRSTLNKPIEPTKPTVSTQPCEPETPEGWSETDHNELMAFEPQYLQAKRVTAPVQPELTLSAIEHHRGILTMTRRVAELNKLLAQGTLSCESCGHETPLAASLIEQNYSDVDPNYAEVTTYSESDLNRLQYAWQGYDEALDVYEKAQALIASGSVLEPLFPVWKQHHAELATYRNALASWERETETANRLFDEQMTQHSVRIAEVEAENAKVVAWNAEVDSRNKALREQYNNEIQNWETAQARIAELSDVPEQLALTIQALQEWTFFDRDQAMYESQLSDYNAKLAKIHTLKEELLDLDRARKALQETKTNVKSYLTPALSRVASQLLTEMTGGERSTVVIDEDFDVLVDGQPLRTLSGSGKDIVNLAIRISLGQVLTHSVMPMMFLDEVDQGMDADRARYTQSCLQKITPSIGQVLIVSHRPTVADHTIEI